MMFTWNTLVKDIMKVLRLSPPTANAEFAELESNGPYIRCYDELIVLLSR